jgi:hypothetical protein
MATMGLSFKEVEIGRGRTKSYGLDDTASSP